MNNWPFRNIHDYLQKQGLLDQPDQALIKQAKKHYWKQYRLHHKRESRNQNSEITISFPKKLKTELEKAAQESQISMPEYIFRITLDSLNYPVRNTSPIQEQTQQTISLIYTEIQDIARNYLKDNSDLQELYKTLLIRVEQIEELLNQEVWL